MYKNINKNNMKYLIILVIVSGLFLGSTKNNNMPKNESKKEISKNEMPISSNKKVSIILLDKDTNEKLTGVKNKNDNSYSNFDGELLVDKNSIVSLELISYKDIQ